MGDNECYCPLRVRLILIVTTLRIISWISYVSFDIDDIAIYWNVYFCFMGTRPFYCIELNFDDAEAFFVSVRIDPRILNSCILF